MFFVFPEKSFPNNGILLINGSRSSTKVESFCTKPLKTITSPDFPITWVVTSFSEVGGGFPELELTSAPRLETEAVTEVVIVPFPETEPTMSKTKPDTISFVTPD